MPLRPDLNRTVPNSRVLAALATLMVLILSPGPTPARADPPAPASPADPVVRVEGGLVSGQRQGPAMVFRGVPYAAAPVGPLRWRPPAPVPAWRGIRPARDRAPACLQFINPDGSPNGGGYVGPVSEDCLTLNVTAPVRRAHGGGRAPVMVWIPGGGNVQGGAEVPSYDAVNFARDGVIVVTMNYRLGAFGFLAHPALTRAAGPGEALGNYGLEDQIAALRWVRRNIAAFGGDPSNVTLFGESAGGSDTLALMTTPRARGLFRRAIVQSGGGWSPPRRLADAEAAGVALATRLGLPPTATADDLRRLDAAALTNSALAEGGTGATVDGRMFTRSPTQAFASGQVADVPLIIGSNSNEASLAGPRVLGIAAAASPALRAAYEGVTPEAELGRQLFNDGAMGAPARWIARQASGGAPSWLYYFSYVPERQRQTRPGTNHASEVPFVFDSLDAVPGRTPLITPSEREAARLTHSCWVAFARTGRPNCAGQAWPAYRAATDQLLEVGVETGVRTRFRARQLDAQERENAALLGVSAAAPAR